MSPAPSPDDAERHLPLSEAVFQILLSLSDDALHGYAVIQDVRERTDGAVELTASTLYGALKRLRGEGLVRELEKSPEGADDDPRRRYYTATPSGVAVVRAEVRRLRRAVDAAVDKGLVSPGRSGGR